MLIVNEKISLVRHDFFFTRHVSQSLLPWYVLWMVRLQALSCQVGSINRNLTRFLLAEQRRLDRIVATGETQAILPWNTRSSPLRLGTARFVGLLMSPQLPYQGSPSLHADDSTDSVKWVQVFSGHLWHLSTCLSVQEDYNVHFGCSYFELIIL